MTREDKDAIIRRLEAMYGEAEENETKEALFYAIESLKEQRPHGEWVLDKEFSFVFNIYECSKCRFDGSKRWHFCPNCGADMRGEEK